MLVQELHTHSSNEGVCPVAQTEESRCCTNNEYISVTGDRGKLPQDTAQVWLLSEFGLFSFVLLGSRKFEFDFRH